MNATTPSTINTSLPVNHVDTTSFIHPPIPVPVTTHMTPYHGTHTTTVLQTALLPPSLPSVSVPTATIAPDCQSFFIVTSYY